MDNAPPPPQPFWNVGAAPTDPAGGLSYDGVTSLFMEALGGSSLGDVMAEVPPVVRPRAWGTVDRTLSASPGATQRALNTARLEREALISLCKEVLVSPVAVDVPNRPNRPAVKSYIVPASNSIDALLREMKYKCEISERAAYAPALSEQFGDATRCLRGTYYTTAGMQALASSDRLACVLHSSESTPDWWLYPAVEGGFHKYDNADRMLYGRMQGVEKVIERMRDELKQTRALTDELMVVIFEAPWVMLPTLAEEAPASWRKCRITDEDTFQQRLVAVLNGDNAMIPEAFVAKLRKMITDRCYKLRGIFSEAICLRRQANVSVTRRRAVGHSRLLETLTTVDLMKPMIDMLGPADASCFYRVLRCANYADADVLAVVRARYPHLHIYVSPGAWPHRVVAGEYHVYARKQLQISVGLVTSRLRSGVRSSAKKEAERQRDERPVNEPTFNVYDNSGTYADRERRRMAYVTEFRKWNLGTKAKEKLEQDFDFGYADGEAKIRVRDSDMCNPESTRWVNGGGWNLVDVELDEELQLNTIDPGQLFLEPPELSLTLVNADTGQPVVPGHKYGGIEPEKHLYAAGKIFMQCGSETSFGTAAVTVGWRPDDGKKMPRAMRTMVSNIATRIKMWPTCLSSQRKGVRFKIVLEATARTKKAPHHAVRLRTESQPIVFKSTPSPAPAAKKQKVGGK